MRLFRFSFRVMGGPAELQLAGQTRGEAEHIAQALEAECRRIESVFSRYDEASMVSRVNHAAGKQAIAVNDELAALLDYASVCFNQSQGLFDITSGILRRAWDFKSKRLPNQSEIAALLPLIGWDKVEWRPPQIKLPKQGMEIDLGGLAKEYAVDRCVAAARAEGVPAGLVNLAGDVRTFGPSPQGSQWRVGIVHPRQAGELLASIEAGEAAIATSGDYERFMEIDGKRYCHILNPKTGYPVEELQSVTVIASSCLIAGTASTIAMLLGKKEGVSYLQELGLPYIVRTAKGETQQAKVKVTKDGRGNTM